MVIMALDHTRDYFHYDSFFFDPADPEHTNTFLFVTRWITHYCAPIFSFLAGISAFLVGQRKSKKELSIFLLKRGIWLVFIEFTVVIFGWSFNIHFNSFGMLVIWSLGISMIFLAAFIHLPLKYILIVSLGIIFGHNFLDYVDVENNLWWSILHQRGYYTLFDGIKLRVVYPIVPWIGVMSLGYYFGSFYNRTTEPQIRKKLFAKIGMATILLFFIVRAINLYGNPKPWSIFDTIPQTLFSFLDPLKYPPSLSYLLMTLGPTFIFLAYSENMKGKVVNFLNVYGRVPFFFYIIHIYVIHIFATMLAVLTGFGYKAMILTGFVSGTEALKGFGLSLGYVFLIWIGITVMLYPLSKKFSDYKLEHKEKSWLSYF